MKICKNLLSSSTNLSTKLIKNKKLIRTFKFNFSCNEENETRSFGYKNVKWEDHQKLVNNVFASVAGNYDLMNDVLSLGVHRLWKTEFVNQIGSIRPNKILKDTVNMYEEIVFPMKIIDVAGGTGDISFKILDKADDYFKRNIDIYPVEIKVIDINKNMLEEGKIRASKQGISESRLEFIECNAEKLDFIQDSSIDLYTISFGIRNCTRRDNVLKEALRVLKKGGRFMCMEFSEVQLPLFDKFYDFYSENIIPELGAIFAKDKESYKYLIESIKKFPKQEQFKYEIEQAGFKFVKYNNLSAGICAIHSGIKF